MSNSHDHQAKTACSSCEGDKASSAVISAMPTDGNGHLRHYRIPNMDCPTEEADIRQALSGIEGIARLQFSLGQRVLTIEAEPEAHSMALAAIAKAGFKAEILQNPDQQTGNSETSRVDTVRADAIRVWGKLALALVLALLAESLAWFYPGITLAAGLGMAMAAAAIALSGFSVYGKGLAALRQGHLNINALMSVAVTGAFLIGQWPEAAMVMALYSLAEAIEARAVDRARHAISSLLALAPEQADMQQPDGSWMQVPTRAVPLGAIVRVRPGERIPMDGVVTAGMSAIDQSPVTGESLPIDKQPGDEVFAGTINQVAELALRVTALASDSTLARIIHAVEQAQGSRAPTQRFVDRFAAIYTPAIFCLAVAVALLSPWWLGWSWSQSIYKALVLLVIACPCALVISTPVTVVSGLAAAARRGILIKGGAYLEEARKISVVALDKTGTITEGKPRLVSFDPVDTTRSQQDLERLAKALASRSDHPVSQAIAAGLMSATTDTVSELQAMPGRGVQGMLDGQAYVLANHRWIEERHQCSAELEARLLRHETAGRTVTLLADEQGVLAVCSVADTIKPSSAEAIVDLQALGIQSVMLTGDNEATGKTVAAAAGITAVQANLLPEDKLQAIAALRLNHAVVAMVGDGINDAPALASASIGFAMGGMGTHTAMEAADVVIMNDDLRRLPETVRLSRRVHTILWQNISLALGIKLVFLLLALFNGATMWMAVFADMGASLLVVFNGLRLLRQ